MLHLFLRELVIQLSFKRFFQNHITKFVGSNYKMNLELKEKVVIVTGASKGIGKAIALAFGAEGCRVVVCARNEKELNQVAQHIRDFGGEALTIVADVTNKSDVERMVNETVARFGTVHVLVNNAGGTSKAFAEFDTITDMDWLHDFELNVFSAVKMIRAVLPCMQSQKWGRIINISSENGTQPDATMPHYNASKAALTNLSKSLSKAYGRYNILINTVSPAWIMTPLLDTILTDQAQARGITREEMEQDSLKLNRPNIEVGRSGTPEEVASAVVFLASESASFITGENLRVDGGSVASI